jgi:hypothetical protein
MADPREFFPILENTSTNAGEAPAKVQSGDDPSGKNGLIAIGTVDSSGNLAFLKLDPEGRLKVTQEASGVLKRARGELSSGSVGSLVAVTNAEISLTPGKTYVDIAMLCSCRGNALFQLIHLDNLTENILAEVVLDSGQYTMQVSLPQDEITAGGTGTQKLLVKAKNFQAPASSLRATITAVEVA